MMSSAGAGRAREQPRAQKRRPAARLGSQYDSLTRLPNRLLLNERLEALVKEAAEHRQAIAVLLVGIEGFGTINETLGLDCADQLLLSAAERLRPCVAAGGFLARSGDHEFAVIVIGAQARAAARMGQPIIEKMARPFRLGRQEALVKARVGVALSVDGAEGSERLMRNAYLALRSARTLGDDAVCVHTPEMDHRVASRLALEQDLRHAVARGELHVVYQPKVDLRDGRIDGAEALLRWSSARHGAVSPDVFIPIAEETGLIVPIGEWALRTACVQASQWRSLSAHPVSLSVNMSPRQFRHKDVTGMVERVLKDTGMRPGDLEIELTESVCTDLSALVRDLRRLKNLGVRLAIDDFGVGFSCLSRLWHLPVDTVKIDKAFVEGIGVAPDTGRERMTTAVISLGHGAGLHVVAEGVETQEQLDFLRRQRCDAFQGFLFSRAVPAEHFSELLGAARPSQELHKAGCGCLDCEQPCT